MAVLTTSDGLHILRKVNDALSGRHRVRKIVLATGTTVGATTLQANGITIWSGTPSASTITNIDFSPPYNLEDLTLTANSQNGVCACLRCDMSVTWYASKITLTAAADTITDTIRVKKITIVRSGTADSSNGSVFGVKLSTAATGTGAYRNITGLTLTFATAPTPDTILRSSGSWLTSGFEVGDMHHSQQVRRLIRQQPALLHHLQHLDHH